jgi:hypothetical protein
MRPSGLEREKLGDLGLCVGKLEN